MDDMPSPERIGEAVSMIMMAIAIVFALILVPNKPENPDDRDIKK